jgi:type I restriction enzyme S subunit
VSAINLINNELPDNWVITKLSDFAHIDMGQSPASDTYNLDGQGLPFFQGKSEFGHVFPEIRKYCSLPKKIAEKGATLLSVRAPVGPTNLAKTRCCIGRGLAAIQPLGGVEEKFILFLIRSIEGVLSSKGTGSTFSAISKKQIDNLIFAVPPLNEQKRIVAKIEELFSELDNGIAALKTAREKLKLYRQAVLKHAFEGKLTAQWREENKDKLETPEQLLARTQKEREARYQQQLEEWKAAVKAWEEKGKEGKKPGKPKFSKQNLFLPQGESSNLPALPNGYVYTYLSNLGDLGRGKSKHRPRNDPCLFGGKYPFVQTGDIKSANRRINTYTQTYNEFGLKQSKLWPKGTLCITIAANIAETAFLGFDGCFPDSVVGFSSYGSVCPEYVELFIKAVRVRIEAYAPATAQKNINLKTLENLVIPYCSIIEQIKVVEKLNYVLSVIDKNEIEIDQALNRAETLRQSILKKAFSGQLVPQDPNDEPASELLARIQAEKAAQQAAAKGKKRQSNGAGRPRWHPDGYTRG